MRSLKQPAGGGTGLPACHFHMPPRQAGPRGRPPVPLARVAVLLLAAGAARAEIIDRVAVLVGDRVITQSEMLLQMRVAAFLNADPVNLDAANKRQAAERLIAQTLIRREMDLSRYSAPSLPEADAVLATLRREPRFAGDEKFAGELARYEVSEEDVRQQLLWQLTLLRFVEYRFRPAVAPSEQDLRGYYEKQFLPRWRKLNAPPPPSFDDSLSEIEKAVSDRMLDDALERWLKQARAQTRIRFREEVFR